MCNFTVEEISPDGVASRAAINFLDMFIYLLCAVHYLTVIEYLNGRNARLGWIPDWSFIVENWYRKGRLMTFGIFQDICLTRYLMLPGITTDWDEFALGRLIYIISKHYVCVRMVQINEHIRIRRQIYAELISQNRTAFVHFKHYY